MTIALHELHCTVFGVSFQLIAESDGVLARMLACAPLGTQSGVLLSADAQAFKLLGYQEGAIYRLVISGEIVAENVELQIILNQLSRDLMVHVANHASDRIFVHAGVVGWQNYALVLPGSSFAGKTTLVAELVRAGAAYYSDEYAVFDEHGQVHPYSRPLQMRLHGSTEQTAVAVEDLNGSAGSISLPVSHVVFTEYVESGHWYPEAISAGIAVLEMLRHAIPVQRTPARVMATLARMMETAKALRSERGEASETARTLLSIMSVSKQSMLLSASGD